MSRFSITMATGFVPLLARIVLCAAFLTMGWNKLMNTHEFRGQDAEVLLDLGIVDEAAPVAGSARTPGTPASVALTRIAYISQEDDVAEDDTPPTIQQRGREALDEVRGEVEEAVEDVREHLPRVPREVLRTDPATGDPILEAKRMHTVTLAVAKHDWPEPVLMAWASTLTELIGGALLLIGLFSRVWGLGLAITMGVAFYMTSLPVLMESDIFAMAADLEGGYADFNRMYCQLGLFVLALGIFLTGAGPVSLDRWLFRSSSTPRDGAPPD